MARSNVGRKVAGKLVWNAEKDCWVEEKPKPKRRDGRVIGQLYAKDKEPRNPADLSPRWDELQEWLVEHFVGIRDEGTRNATRAFQLSEHKQGNIEAAILYARDVDGLDLGRGGLDSLSPRGSRLLCAAGYRMRAQHTSHEPSRRMVVRSEPKTWEV